MRYVDLFAGIGGFRNALDSISRKKNSGSQTDQAEEPGTRPGLQPVPGQAVGTEVGYDSHSPANGADQRSFTCVYSNEWDRYANSVYRKHFQECDIRDIRTVDASEIPNHDLICAGFPCQAFSQAGKRGGFSDTRGTLFFEIMRIAKQKRTPYLLLENVRGLLSHHQGNTFRVMLQAMDELGYDCQWQVLDSKDFHVPQSRQRIFIIGHLRTQPRPQVFPFTGNGGQANRLKELTSGLADANRIYDPSGLAKTLKGLAGGLGAKTGLYRMGDMQIRKLTPNECELLQAFPSGWTNIGVFDATPEMYNSDYANAKKTNAIEILQALQQTISQGKGKRWGFAKFIPLLKKEILQPEMYAERLSGKVAGWGSASSGELQGKAISYCNRMFEVWKQEKSGHSPQRQEQVEQFFEELRGVMQKLPHKIAQTGRFMEATQTSTGQKNGQVYFQWMSDTQRYKMTGNAVTTTVVKAIGERLIDEIESGQ
jgi:DNA (cytosine-5)-methyltransferase 1